MSEPYTLIGRHPWDGKDPRPLLADGSRFPDRDFPKVKDPCEPEDELHAYVEKRPAYWPPVALCGFKQGKGCRGKTRNGDGRPLCVNCARELAERSWI